MRRRKFPNGALEIGDRRVALAQPNLHIARRDRQLNFRLDVASLFRRNFQFRKKLRRFAITSGARLNLGEALQDVDAIGVTPNSLRPNRVRFVDSIKSDVRFSKFFKDFDAGVVRQLFSKRALPSVASLLKTPRRRQRFAKRRRNWRPARSRRLRFAQRFDRVVLSGTANLRKPQEIEPLPFRFANLFIGKRLQFVEQRLRFAASDVIVINAIEGGALARTRQQNFPITL